MDVRPGAHRTGARGKARRSKRVELPEGVWCDLYTGERHEGGRAIARASPDLSSLPVFVPEGTLLVADASPLDRRAFVWPAPKLEAWAYPDSAARARHAVHRRRSVARSRAWRRRHQAVVRDAIGAFTATRLDGNQPLVESFADGSVAAASAHVTTAAPIPTIWMGQALCGAEPEWDVRELSVSIRAFSPVTAALPPLQPGDTIVEDPQTHRKFIQHTDPVTGDVSLKHHSIERGPDGAASTLDMVIVGHRDGTTVRDIDQTQSGKDEDGNPARVEQHIHTDFTRADGRRPRPGRSHDLQREGADHRPASGHRQAPQQSSRIRAPRARARRRTRVGPDARRCISTARAATTSSASSKFPSTQKEMQLAKPWSSASPSTRARCMRRQPTRQRSGAG